MKMNKSKYLILLATVMLASCQSNESLETSVNNRWAAIVNDELERAYEYFSPGYKEVENLKSFKLRIATAKIQMNWKQGQYAGSECETETICTVKVLVDYTYTFPKRSMGNVDVQTELDENWINIDNKWYFVPKKEKLN